MPKIFYTSPHLFLYWLSSWCWKSSNVFYDMSYHHKHQTPTISTIQEYRFGNLVWKGWKSITTSTSRPTFFLCSRFLVIYGTKFLNNWLCGRNSSKLFVMPQSTSTWTPPSPHEPEPPNYHCSSHRCFMPSASLLFLVEI